MEKFQMIFQNLEKIKSFYNIKRSCAFDERGGRIIYVLYILSNLVQS